MIENEFGTFVDNEIIGESSEEVFQRYLNNLNKKVEKEPTLADLNRADIDYLAIMTGVEL